MAAALTFFLSGFIAGTAAERRGKKSDSPTFGTDKPLYGAFRGLVYALDKQAGWLPDLSSRKPVGVYFTYALNYSLRTFEHEYFAIDYRGRFHLREAGQYRFYLESDDGAMLYIDDRRIINNDGVHAAEEKEAGIELTAGEHTIRVPYFQGPQPYVALILSVKPPGGKKQPFDLRDYALPSTETSVEERPTLQRKSTERR